MLRKSRAKAAKAAPAPVAEPGQVLLRCEDLGETRPFEAAHAARILARQAREERTGDGTWQPVEGAPAAKESAQ